MIRYLSLFSGIGAFEKALQRLKIPYELVGYSEIDKYANKAYSLIHNVPETLNYGDMLTYYRQMVFQTHSYIKWRVIPLL